MHCTFRPNHQLLRYYKDIANSEFAEMLRNRAFVRFHLKIVRCLPIHRRPSLNHRSYARNTIPRSKTDKEIKIGLASIELC